MANYQSLSKELQERIIEDRKLHKVNPYAFRDEDIVRRKMDHDIANIWRPAFVRDTEKILHNPYYNRYSDKTQVFSGYRNDDISRRGLHVQLVSRIARNIGQVLGLNESLIEAISLGHDIGHTPFGHAGERFLNKIYQERTGRFFNHNVHSVRVLDQLISRNISLQVLDGVLCHNGEAELEEYRPVANLTFESLDNRIEACYTDASANKKQIPSTLEACVMRVCDIIAYLGKDRQDAMRVGILSGDQNFSAGELGSSNAEIINNMIVNIIENSYGKDYICMDKAYYDAFSKAKSENYEWIYGNPEVDAFYKDIGPMFEMVYEALFQELRNGTKDTYIYRDHIQFLLDSSRDMDWYFEEEPNQIVVDYMASMTDDYFLDLFHVLYPDSKLGVTFKGYWQ